MRCFVCCVLLLGIPPALGCRGKKDESGRPNGAPKGGLERLVGTWELEPMRVEGAKFRLVIHDDGTGSYTIDVDGRDGFVTHIVPMLRQELGEKAADPEFDKQVKSVAVRAVCRFPFRVEQVSGEEIA